MFYITNLWYPFSARAKNIYVICWENSPKWQSATGSPIGQLKSNPVADWPGEILVHVYVSAWRHGDTGTVGWGGKFRRSRRPQFSSVLAVREQSRYSWALEKADTLTLFVLVLVVSSKLWANIIDNEKWSVKLKHKGLETHPWLWEHQPWKTAAEYGALPHFFFSSFFPSYQQVTSLIYKKKVRKPLTMLSVLYLAPFET
jgi:hypothetical protein